MEKIPKILKLQAKLNKIFQSPVIKWNITILRNTYREVREVRGRRLNSQGILFSQLQSLTVFFPEYFKTAQSSELKLGNFATNRLAEPPPPSAPSEVIFCLEGCKKIKTKTVADSSCRGCPIQNTESISHWSSVVCISFPPATELSQDTGLLKCSVQAITVTTCKHRKETVSWILIKTD